MFTLKFVTALALFASCSAQALLTFDLYEGEHGADAGVWLRFSGSANLAGLTLVGSLDGEPFLNLGRTVVRSSTRYSGRYEGITGPIAIGPGGFTRSGVYIEGDNAGFGQGDSGILVLILPMDYVSESLISGSSFFSGLTLDMLGFAGGEVFEWNWGDGEDADKLVLNVLTQIPEPAQYAMIGAVVALAVAGYLRRRQAATGN